MFRMLGAPLKNTRWSWGAVREDDTMVLRVWADKVSNRRAVVLDNMDRISCRNGLLERIEHIDLIQQGAAAILVICHAKEVASDIREIDRFNQRMFLIGEGLIETGDSMLVPIIGRRDYHELQLMRAAHTRHFAEQTSCEVLRE